MPVLPQGAAGQPQEARGQAIKTGETGMSGGKPALGRIRTEVHGRVFKIIIDNPTKKDSFTPQMMAHMSDALVEVYTFLHPASLFDRRWNGFSRRVSVAPIR
jgi:hypothetical protein